MSERFIKFIPSEEAMFLVIHKPNAFRLLTIIAERARRENGCPDGLTVGQCHLGDWKNCGLTEKEYRTAKEVLVKRGHLKIVETCRTRKKSATGTTTIGTLVEILTTTVYDINKNVEGDRKGDRGATEGRPRGDEQERIRMNKKEEEEQIAAFAEKKVIGLDFSNSLENQPILQKSKKSKKSEEKKFFREAVSLTQEQYDSLLEKHGQEALNWMLDKLENQKLSTGKKYSSDYHAILNWVVGAYNQQVKVNTKNERKTLDAKGIPIKNNYEGRF